VLFRFKIFEQQRQISPLFTDQLCAYYISQQGDDALLNQTYIKELTMKTIKTFAAVVALTVLPFASFAQSITATASTLDGAEAQIAAQAHEAGASYKVTEANFNNGVHMTAELTK